MGSKKGVKRGKYRSHLVQNEGELYCSECTVKYKKKSSLVQHFKTHHLKQRMYCPECQNTFYSTSTLNRHIRDVHKIHKSKTGKHNTPSSASTDNVHTNNHQFSDTRCEVSSKLLSIAKNDTFGKHVIARANIEANTLLCVSKEFASIHCIESIGSTCLVCGKPKDKKFYCSSCMDVYFCSEECSRNQIHERVCNRTFLQSDCYQTRLAVEIIQRAFSLSTPEEVIRFANDTLFKKAENQTCQPLFYEYVEMLKLKGLICQSNELTKKMKRVVDCILSLPKVAESNTSRHALNILASRHLATIDINSFSEEFSILKGKCTRYSMHPMLSRINHSCAPNVEHFYDDNNAIRCVTTRLIKTGEQIFISYLGEMEFGDIASRRKYLQTHWCFKCECDVCQTITPEVN